MVFGSDYPKDPYNNLDPDETCEERRNLSDSLSRDLSGIDGVFYHRNRHYFEFEDQLYVATFRLHPLYCIGPVVLCFFLPYVDCPTRSLLDAAFSSITNHLLDLVDKEYSVRGYYSGSSSNVTRLVSRSRTMSHKASPFDS